MSEVPETRDSENNWVIASTEGFPVETLGAEHSEAEPHIQEQDASADSAQISEAPQSNASATTKESKESESPPATFTTSTHASHQEQLEIPPEETYSTPQDQEPLLPKPSSGLTSKVGEDLEEVSCSSSDDDAEGLRKRVVRGAAPVSVGPAPRVALEQEPDAGPNLTLNKCIIAALALIGIGFLAFSGGGYSTEEDSPQPVITRSVKAGEKPPQAIADIEDWMHQHAAQFTGDPSSLQVMTSLLDKVAKENQDIRHMQAKLQAHKDELEAMLKTSKSGGISPTPQQLDLSEENVGLKEALLKEETAHLAVKEELENLQEKLESVEGSSLENQGLQAENALLKEEVRSSRSQIEGFLAQKETLVAESQMLRQELDKQRLLVASIRRDLENLTTQDLHNEAEGEQPLQNQITEMNNRLATEIQRSEMWEKKYVEHSQKRKEQSREQKVAHSHKEWKQLEKSVRHPNISKSDSEYRKPVHGFKHGKDHGKKWAEESPRESQHEEWRSKKHEHRGEKREQHRQDKKSRHWEREEEKIPTEPKQHHQPREKIPGESERGRDSEHHHQDNRKEKQWRHHHEENGGGFHPRKGQKDFHESLKEEKKSQRKEQGEKSYGKDSHHRHHDHNKFWKKLSDHRYRIPEGCSGLEDCARKDGLDLYNVELKPVQRKQFEDILRSYLTKSELSKHLPELLPLLDGFFEGPVFTHHKIRFRDFVDDVEDFLEDLARRETGDDDLVDDFEKFVYTNFFGEAAVSKKRSPKKEAHKKIDTAEDRWQRPPSHETNHHQTKIGKKWQLDNTHGESHPSTHKNPFQEAPDMHIHDQKYSNKRDEKYHQHNFKSLNKHKNEKSDFHHDLRSINHKHEGKKHSPSKYHHEKNAEPSPHHSHWSTEPDYEDEKLHDHPSHRESTFKDEHGHNPSKHNYEKRGQPYHHHHHHSDRSAKPAYGHKDKLNHHGDRESPTYEGPALQHNQKVSKSQYEKNRDQTLHPNHRSSRPYHQEGERDNSHQQRESTYKGDGQFEQQKHYNSHTRKKEPAHYHKEGGYSRQHQEQDGLHYKTRHESKQDHLESYKQGSFSQSYENEDLGNQQSYRFSKEEKPQYQYGRALSRQKQERDLFNKHHRSHKHQGSAQPYSHNPPAKDQHWKKPSPDDKRSSSEFSDRKEGRPNHHHHHSYHKHCQEEVKSEEWLKEKPDAHKPNNDKRSHDHWNRKREGNHQKEATEERQKW